MGKYLLGKLIEDLKNLNLDLIVEIDDGTFPNPAGKNVFDSWRGFYCELAIQYSKENKNITVAEFLKMAESVNGTWLTGYKGGSFLMDLQTPINIANYGCCGILKLIGVKEINGKAVLITAINERVVNFFKIVVDK